MEPNPFRAGFLQFVGVANSRKEAIDLYREPAEYFYNRCLHVDPRFTGPPGYLSDNSIRANLTSQVAAAAGAAQDRYASVLAKAQKEMEGFVEKGYARKLRAGTPRLGSTINVRDAAFDECFSTQMHP
jgi:hypothetical protein